MPVDYRDVYTREWQAYLSSEVHPGESVLLEVYKDKWPTARMLDLGVGAGRTTWIFAPLVRDYVGVDSVAKMVDQCRGLFQETPNRRFLLADAVNLKEFADDSFDIVLFSFNGIDHLDLVDRTKALTEVHRVLKPGGVFFFSSHSLDVLPHRTPAMPPLEPNPVRWLSRLLKNRKERHFFSKVNLLAADADAQDRGWAVLPDKAHGGEMEFFYIRPKAQIGHLERVGFSVEKVINTKGETVRNIDSPGEDWWFHYLCTAKKPFFPR
jgi:SAM-dependent methyltransferase